MKSCLKASSHPGSPDPRNSACRKCVAFNAVGSEEIHWADEWDRTPTEPARNLSYQELLELKEIQQSLPHASQPSDLQRPGKQLLSMVPIGLLPLASAETSGSPMSPTPQSPPSTVPQPTFVMPPGRARVPTPTRMASASLTHLRPPAPAPPRVKPAFAFLPLLSSDSTASTSTSTSKVNNDVPPADPGSYFPEYSPARSAADGEPDRVLPSPIRARAIPISGTVKVQHPVGGYERAYRAAEAAAYSPPFGSSAYDYARDRRDMLGDSARAAAIRSSTSSNNTTATAGGKKKKKSFMFINDEVVEIEEDDEEETLPQLVLPPPTKPVPPSPPMKMAAKSKPASPPPISSSPSMSALSISASPPQTSPRLAIRPLSPASARPVSPLSPVRPVSPLTPTSAAAGRLSPVQARSSSRLVRI